MSSIRTAFWNESQARFRAGWRLAIQLLLNIGFFLLISSLARSRFSPFDADSPWTRVVLAPLAVGVTLLSVWLAGRFLDRRLFSDFGLHLNLKAWWADFAIGLVLGIALPLGFVLVGMAIGIVVLEPVFMSGFLGLPFWLGVLLAALVYLCVGVFEEVGRAYQIRNLLEGTAQGLGLRNAAVVAVIGASTISVIMHSGDLAFLAFVLLAAAIKGCCYLLTGRVGIALGYHAAWDFALATILGIGAEGGASGSTAFYAMQFVDTNWGSTANDSEITLPTLLVLVVLEFVALLLILGWTRLRYGNPQIRKDLTTPTLWEPTYGSRGSVK